MHTEQKLPALSGTVLWLIPSEAEKDFFRKEIGRLSDRFNTLRFTPHLTLGRFPARYSKKDTISTKFKMLSASGDDVHAVFDALKCTDSPYQNLIASLKPSGDVERLQSRIEELVPGYRPKEEYHISLMYGKVPCTHVQDKLTDIRKRLPEFIHFSKICAVQLNGGPDGWDTLWERHV